MGQILTGCAATTHAVRAYIQRLEASNAALSWELGLNAKTIAKWRKRDGVEDAAMGPKATRSTVLSEGRGGVGGRFSPLFIAAAR